MYIQNKKTKIENKKIKFPKPKNLILVFPNIVYKFIIPL